MVHMIQVRRDSKKMHQRRTPPSLPGMESMQHVDSSDLLRYRNTLEGKIHCMMKNLALLSHPTSRSDRQWEQWFQRCSSYQQGKSHLHH